MYKKQAIIESIELELTLTDPIVAETQCFEVLKKFKEATENDKRKIKVALLNAINKAQDKRQTFIASIYRQAYRKLEYE